MTRTLLPTLLNSDSSPYKDQQTTAPCSHEKPSEEDIRACFFTTGVMMLELILDHGIEECRFRKSYYGNVTRAQMRAWDILYSYPNNK